MVQSTAPICGAMVGGMKITRTRIVLPAVAAVAITIAAIISFARGTEPGGVVAPVAASDSAEFR